MASTAKTSHEPLPVAGLLNSAFAGKSLDIFPAPASGGVVTLTASTSVGDACATLSTNNILCAPVIDDTLPADAGWSDKVLGIVDFLSLVAWMLQFTEGEVPNSFHLLLNSRKEFKQTKLRELVGQGRWAPFVPVDARIHNALDVMILLGKYGLHRVVQVESPGKGLKNIITQSSVVRLLNEQIDQEPFTKVAQHSLRELGLGVDQHILTVRDTDHLLEAFKIIGNKLVSAVPVVDDKGRLVGTVSAKDLRGLTLNPELFAFLRLPIKDFPLLSRNTRVCCRAEDSIRVVIQRIVENNIHRLWVCSPDAEGKEKVTGVVSLRDILSSFTAPPADDPFQHFFTAH